jgi:hypothetical protein
MSSRARPTTPASSACAVFDAASSAETASSPASAPILKLTHEQRLELIRKPFPPVGCVRIYGGRSHGGIETYQVDSQGVRQDASAAVQIARARGIRTGRKPAMHEVEGQ